MPWHGFDQITWVLPRTMARRLAGRRPRYLDAAQVAQDSGIQFGLAFPEWTGKRREVKRNGAQPAGWRPNSPACRSTPKKHRAVRDSDGHENFRAGQRRGSVIFHRTHRRNFLPAHAVYGFPLRYAARPLDNKPLDALVNQYRGLSGNTPIFKNDAARGMLRILKEAVQWVFCGPEHHAAGGVFVDFGTPMHHDRHRLRRLHTDAAVVPAYVY